MTLEEQIQSVLQETADFIKQNLEDKGINASGRTSASIKVRKVASGYELGKFPEGKQTAPLQTLEIGRPGWRVPKGFKYIIWDWMDAKGISTGDPKEDARRAGAIAYGKIRKIGTNRWTAHEDVFSTPVKMAADELNKNVKAVFNSRISEMINTNF